MSTFVLMYFFVLLYFFCSEMAAGGQDLLACKILGFQLEKWLTYWTRYERGHYITTSIITSSSDYTVQTRAKALKYLSLDNNVRDTYKARFGLFDFAENYKNDKRFTGNSGLCKCRRERESEPHLLSGQCEVFGDIRANYGDLKDDESLVKFFKEVLELRDSLDEAKSSNQ